MSKRPEDFEEFSLEEIIAEIKGTVGRQERPAPLPRPEPELSEQGPTHPEPPEPKPAQGPTPPEQGPKNPAPVAFKARRPDEGAARKPPPPAQPAQPVAFGRRLIPEKPGPAQRIFEEEAGREAAREAPWRTRRQPGVVPGEPTEADTQEFEIVLDAPGPDAFEAGDAGAEESEDPGAARRASYDFINQVFPDAQTAVHRLDKRIASMSARFMGMLLPLALSGYMTVGPALGLPMPFGFAYWNYPYYYLFVLVAAHIVAIGLAAEVTAAGLMRLLRLRPTLDSLVLFGQLCIMAHTLSVLIVPRWGGYLPFTCAGILTCLAALAAKRQRAEALRRAYRVTLMGTVPSAVKQGDEGGVRTAFKSEAGAWVDMAAIAQPDSTERLGGFVAPVAIAATVGLAMAASFGQGDPGRFLWCLAAIGAAGAPVSLALSASMPTRALSKKLFGSGGSLISAERTRRLARCQAVVLRDGDLFPPGAVEIGGIKIATSHPMEIVLGCAAAAVQEIGGGLARAFQEFAHQRYIEPMRAENVRFFESGGLSVQVEGRHVLLGGASFLMRMGVRVTEGVKLANCLFLAIDGAFAGIFSIKYAVQPQVYAALRQLRAGRLTPVLATRDFNITQAHVESRFRLRAGSTEYPDLDARIRLSGPETGEESDALAILSREGILPFAEALVAAKRQRRAVRQGQMAGLAALTAGMMIMYFLVYQAKVTSATPQNVLIYLLLWLVVTWVGSFTRARM